MVRDTGLEPVTPAFSAYGSYLCFWCRFGAVFFGCFCVDPRFMAVSCGVGIIELGSHNLLIISERHWEIRVFGWCAIQGSNL